MFLIMLTSSHRTVEVSLPALAQGLSFWGHWTQGYTGYVWDGGLPLDDILAPSPFYSVPRSSWQIRGSPPSPPCPLWCHLPLSCLLSSHQHAGCPVINYGTIVHSVDLGSWFLFPSAVPLGIRERRREGNTQEACQ